jgi:hypothetical protein
MTDFSCQVSVDQLIADYTSIYEDFRSLVSANVLVSQVQTPIRFPAVKQPGLSWNKMETFSEKVGHLQMHLLAERFVFFLEQ